MKFLCLAALLVVCFTQIEANPLSGTSRKRNTNEEEELNSFINWMSLNDDLPRRVFYSEDDLEEGEMSSELPLGRLARDANPIYGDWELDWDDDLQKRDTNEEELKDFMNWMSLDDDLPRMVFNSEDDDRRKRDTNEEELKDFMNWMSLDDDLPRMVFNSEDDDRQKRSVDGWKPQVEDFYGAKRSAGDELKELVISSQQKNVLNTMMANAQTAFSQAQQGATKFFNAALNSQIGLARETFLKGLEQLQTAADGYMDQGVDALKKYLPGLQGVVASRVDSVSKALDKYVADNKGKMDEVRSILLENAQQTLANLKGKLASAKSTADVASIVNAVDAVENQVVNV